MDTLITDPTGAHDVQHSRWTHLQLTLRGSRSTTLEVDTLTIDPTGAHDLQHSRLTHLQLIPHGLMIYNTRGGHTYNRRLRGSRSTTLEMDTLTIDPTGAQFHDLQHSRWTHLQLTPQGLNSTIYNTRSGHSSSRSTTLEVDKLTIDPQGFNSTIYNTRGGYTYN